MGTKKAAKTCERLYGEDWHAEIGRKGGKMGFGNKGFAADPERARQAGIKSGMVRRQKRALT